MSYTSFAWKWLRCKCSGRILYYLTFSFSEIAFWDQKERTNKKIGALVNIILCLCGWPKVRGSFRVAFHFNVAQREIRWKFFCPSGRHLISKITNKYIPSVYFIFNLGWKIKQQIPIIYMPWIWNKYSPQSFIFALCLKLKPNETLYTFVH